MTCVRPVFYNDGIGRTKSQFDRSWPSYFVFTWGGRHSAAELGLYQIGARALGCVDASQQNVWLAEKWARVLEVECIQNAMFVGLGHHRANSVRSESCLTLPFPPHGFVKSN
ncbi:hypothetical protein HOE425_331320 [Hoeflea sp. EC-HK425]|nr:hypothetical protein HOE425_331320 [Hoeflea sp. EC-HK425]